MRTARIPFFVVATFALFMIAGATGSAYAQTVTTTTLQQTSACLTSGCVTTLTATVTAGEKPVSPGLVYFCNRTDVSCENRVSPGSVVLASDGTAVLRIQLAAGEHSLRAIFHGTKTYARSQSSPLSLVISPASIAPSRTTITDISATSIPAGYALTSTVSALQTPVTGTVSFLDTSNKNVVLTTASLGAGQPSIAYAPGLLDFSRVPSALLANTSYAFPGDFNQDGYQDLQLWDSGGLYHLLLGDGKGGFTVSSIPPSNVLVPSSPAYATIPNGAVIGDFNNDGIPDYAELGSFVPTGNVVNVFLGDGKGNYNKTASPLIPEEEDRLSNLSVADFGNRGIQDIAVTDDYDEVVYIFSGNGDGTFVKHPLGIYGIGYLVGDFDGDGIPDIITRYPADVTLYHGNGDFTFTQTIAQNVAPVGGGFGSYIAGDFNGDGLLDVAAIVGTNTQTTLQTLYYNSQKTIFDLGPNIAVPSGSFVNGADFNGDGLPDFFLFNYWSFNQQTPPPPTLYTAETVVTATATTNSAIALDGTASHNVIASFPGDSLHYPSVSASTPLAGSASGFPNGVAFVLQNNGPDAIGASGEDLGYGGNPPGHIGSGITNSVAIAFDLHNNQGEGSNSIRVAYSGVTYSTTFPPISQSVDLTPSGIDLHNGHRFHATVTYNTTLQVTITDLTTNAVFKEALPFQRPLNGYVDGSMAYVGFTGGTGTGTAVQTIYNWVFTSLPTPTPLYTSPTFPTGFANASNLLINGGATTSGTALDLTYGTLFEAPSVYFTPQVIPVVDPDDSAFYTDFDFQVVNGVGDGFTFVLQNQGPNAQGSSGGGLGYGPDHPDGGAGAKIKNSLAIKFDLHSNAGEGADSTGIYFNGASPTTPSIDLGPSGIVLSSGHVFHAHISSFYDYDALLATLSLTLTDLTKYRVFTTTFNVDPGFVPHTAYAGFTAGTGATPSSIKILNWTWTEQ